MQQPLDTQEETKNPSSLARVLAALIDGLIVLVIGSVPILIVINHLKIQNYEILIDLVIFITGILYFVLAQVFFGNSYGKRIMGIKIFLINGASPTFRQIFYRELIKWIIIFLFVVLFGKWIVSPFFFFFVIAFWGYLLILVYLIPIVIIGLFITFSKNKQGPHDIVAKTVVLEVKSPEDTLQQVMKIVLPIVAAVLLFFYIVVFQTWIMGNFIANSDKEFLTEEGQYTDQQKKIPSKDEIEKRGEESKEQGINEMKQYLKLILDDSEKFKSTNGTYSSYKMPEIIYDENGNRIEPMLSSEKIDNYNSRRKIDANISSDGKNLAVVAESYYARIGIYCADIKNGVVQVDEEYAKTKPTVCIKK